MKKTKIRVIGLDPGIRSFGWSVVDVDREARSLECQVEAGGVIETEPEDALSKTQSNAKRCIEIHAQLVALFDQYKPDYLSCEAVAFPFGKVQTSVVSNLGRVRGLVDTFDRRVVRSYEFTAKEIKKAITGGSTASKTEVQEAILKTVRFASLFQPKSKTLHEHYFDSIGAAVTAWIKVQSERAGEE